MGTEGSKEHEAMNFGEVRNVGEEDSKRIWEIRNDPRTRGNFNNTEEIPLDTHMEWMKNKYFINTDNYCFVLDFNDKIVGYCRFDLQNGKYIVSIAIGQDFQGRGLGYKLLKNSIEKIGSDKKVEAQVQLGNESSLRIFIKNNFKIYNQDNKNYYLSLTT